MIYKYGICVTLVLCLLLPVAEVSAQGEFSAQLSEVGIDANPEFPRPGQKVQLSLNDYGSNTFGAEVIWYLNGEVVPAAKNQRQTEIIAGKVGEEQVIEVELKTSVGGTIRFSRVLSPVYLDIIIEPQTHVPAFYQGRALPSFGSMVNVTAIVDGGNVDPSSLMYTWRVNRKVIEGGPLRGGYKVNFQVPQGDYFTLALEVSRIAGGVVARRAYHAASVKPQLQFYEYTELYGISPLTISDTFIPTNLTNTLQVSPYYLDIKTYNEPDFIEWKVNSQLVPTAANPYQLTFARQFSTGRSFIGFHVRNRTQLLQGAQGGISINY